MILCILNYKLYHNSLGFKYWSGFLKMVVGHQNM